jgi:hypothetical protein
MKPQKCSYCESEEIVQNVKMYCDSAHNFPLRMTYKNPKKSFLRDTLPEYVYADVCSKCGTIVRMYVLNPHDDLVTGTY